MARPGIARTRGQKLVESTSAQDEPKEEQKDLPRAPNENLVLWQNREFGGATGAFLLMLILHGICFWFCVCILDSGGSAAWPDTKRTTWRTIAAELTPTWYAAGLYFGFILSQFIFAAILPGIEVEGMPLTAEGDRMRYNCNACASWWLSLLLLAALHFSGTLSLSVWIDNYGPLFTVSMIAGNLLPFVVYVAAYATKTTTRCSGNVIYDFFMGASLNPRLLGVDIKLWAEVRPSWLMLFILVASCASKQFDKLGYITNSMAFTVFHYFLYGNACHKGEHYIPGTWDIFYEKFGWMLAFWNIHGVPFVYCFHSMFLLHNTTQHSPLWSGVFLAILTITYVIWDQANAQKNAYKARRRGAYKARPWAFPNLPWSDFGAKPRLVQNDRHSLFVDGWYRYGRKIHYSCDIIYALLLGLNCGTGSFLPYFYLIFFIIMINHRLIRDERRCKKKYGALWQEYINTVPYRYIPGLF